MKMSNYPAKYEVLTKQYLRSILDISGAIKPTGSWSHCEFVIAFDEVERKPNFVA